MLKGLFLAVSLVVTLCAACVGGAWAWVKWEYSLPSAPVVQRQFASQRAYFIELTSLLENEQLVSGAHIGGDGTVATGMHSRSVPAYRDLIHRIGAKSVLVREDGSIEFTLRGYGCTLCSDSYMGVRYVPSVLKKVSYPGWTQQVVDSLESAKLPHERGGVASGLYVVPIEPNWFVYRFEYQE